MKWMKMNALTKDDRHQLVIRYFKALEKTIPETEIENYWNELMQRLEQEKKHRRTLRRLYTKIACAAALLGGIIWVSY